MGSRSETGLICQASEAVLSDQECHWVWRPLLFPIMILNKRLTGLRPVVSFISLGQLTVTPLFTPKWMSASDVSSSRTQELFIFFYVFIYLFIFTTYSVQLDLTFGINTNSLVSVIVETNIIVKLSTLL